MVFGAKFIIHRRKEGPSVKGRQRRQTIFFKKLSFFNQNASATDARVVNLVAVQFLNQHNNQKQKAPAVSLVFLYPCFEH